MLEIELKGVAVHSPLEQRTGPEGEQALRGAVLLKRSSVVIGAVLTKKTCRFVQDNRSGMTPLSDTALSKV